MKHFVLMLAFAAYLCADAAPPAVPTLYGYVAEADEARPTGLYTITPTANPTFTLVSSKIVANYGADFIGDTYYCVKGYSNGYGGEYVDLEQYSSETWERTRKAYGKMNHRATDLAYDPTTQTTYGCFLTYNDGEYEYATMDFDTGTRNTGKTLGQSPYNAVAVDADGTLYAIDMNGWLYKALDKAAGVMSAVGNTGVTPRDITSGCIDRRSGRFFWAVRNADGAALYEVDKTTGAATLIASLPYNERITGLCIMTPAVADDAPDTVTDLTVDFPAGALTGKVRFTMPSSTFAGDALSGPLAYIITDGTTTLAEGVEQASAQAEADVTVPQAGQYELAVRASNAAGVGPVSKQKLYIGSDTPLAPVPAAAWTGSKVTINWPAVTEGVNGGYINPATVTYTVVRNPGAVTVADGTTATSVDDALEWPASLTSYTYTVTAAHAGLKSASATTAKLVLGELVPPLTETFDSKTAIENYTIISDNAYSWTVMSSRQTAYLAGGREFDDWLITPPIRLEGGKIYDFTIDAKCESGHSQCFEVMTGNAPTVAALTTAVIQATTISSSEMATFTGRITAPADGVYYIGVHATTGDAYSFDVDNLTLSAGVLPAAPAAPTRLTATAAADGTHTVTITLTTPAVDIDGAPLSDVTKAELYCGESLIKTFEAPGTDKPLSFVHNGAPAGTVKYSAEAYNGSSKGHRAEVEVFVGFNKPVAPAGLASSETDGKVTLSWQAPQADTDGKVIPAEALTYTIYTRDGDGNPVVVADNLTAPTHTWQAVAEGQQYIYLTVAATSEGGQSETAEALYIPAGKAYTLPYHETFSGAATTHIHGITRLSGRCTWQIFDDTRMTGIESLDGDNGFLAMVGDSDGGSAEIGTGKISLAGTDKPALTFYAFNYAIGDNPDNNTVDVLVDDGTGFARVGSTTLSTLGGNGWHRVVTDLSAYAGKTVIIKLRGACISYAQTHIDNMRVMQMKESNLTATLSAAPARIKANSTFELRAGVENTGTEALTPYSIDFYAGDEKIGTADGASMEPGTYASHKITVAPTVANVPGMTVSAIVTHPSDADNSDNTAVTAPIAVSAPGYAVPTALTGQAGAEGVTLSWQAPDMAESLPEARTEDFEGFDSFATAGVDGWTFVDADDGIVSGIQGLNLPGLPEPGKGKLSWFALDSGWSGFIGSAYTAADGKKYLSNMCLYGGGTVDDRAISPELYGGAQTISLIARSFSAEYPETLTVMASQGGTEPGDFSVVTTLAKLSSKWTEYHIDLPDGTRRFALCATTANGFMLHLDRVEFIPAGDPESLVLAGYNVYRDGRRINTTTVSTATYTDATAVGHHTYAVSAVYDKGESGLSDSIDLTSTGIADAATAPAIIEGRTGGIVVRGACGLSVMATTADGRIAASLSASSDYESIGLAPGMYIVRAGLTTAKVVVR